MSKSTQPSPGHANNWKEFFKSTTRYKVRKKIKTFFFKLRKFWVSNENNSILLSISFYHVTLISWYIFKQLKFISFDFVDQFFGFE